MALMRKPVAVFLSVIMLMTGILTLCAYASTADLRYFERGVLNEGDNPTYYIIDKDNKTLYITGNGVVNAMTLDYPSAGEGPFAGRTDITKIVIEEDVARVGDYVCANMTNVDTLEIQSNLLSSDSNMSSKAMIGCTGLRNIQADSSLISTNVLLEVIKGAVNIASANWLSLIRNGISVVSTGVNGDGSLSNEVVHAMVNDFIMTGDEVFLGDLDEAVAQCQAREQEPCYWENAYHHQYNCNIAAPESCLEDGEKIYVCSVCGSFYTEHFGSPLGHSYIDEVLFEPTCTKEGIKKRVCSRCSDICYTSISPTGHTDGRWKMTAIPTRQTGGSIICRCTDCDEITKTLDISMTTTTYIRYKVNLDLNANTVADVYASTVTTGYTVDIVKDGAVLSDSEKVGTGCQVYSTHIASRKVISFDTVVLYGDVDGDGIVGDNDYTVMSDYVMGDTTALANGSVYRRAADLNNDGVVDAFDLSLLDLQISNVKALDQSRPQY